MLNIAEISPLQTSNRRSRLLEIIQSKSVIKGREMRLASGRLTNIYFNLKPSMMDPEGATLLADELLEMVRSEEFESIGGLAVGAIPLVQSVALKCYGVRPLRAFFVRSETKEHGTKERIEANFEDGDRVIILDDVTTTGGSVLKAVNAVRQRGAKVLEVITIVDREEGARENLHNEGIELRALFTKSDFRS